MLTNLTRETQFFPIGRATIACDIEPAQSTPRKLLVLLNGYQRPRSDFRAFRRRLHLLAPHVSTLALDLLGSGESKGDLSHSDCIPSIDLMAQHAIHVAKQFCQILSLESYSVLGISMGGMVAQSLVLNDPHASELILVSTAPCNVMPDSSSSTVDQLPSETHRSRIEKYFGTDFLKKSPVLFDAFLKNTAAQQENKDYKIKAAWQRAAINAFDLSSRMGENTVPTLITTGNEDQIIDCSHSRFLSQKMSLSQLIVYEGVGHLILLEAPIRFTEDVARFLQ